MKLTWDKSADSLYRIQSGSFQDNLDPGVYKVSANPMRGLYLSRITDRFSLPVPLYGKESDFVDRVVKTYHNTKGNLGVLLNGLKGTGKTVTAKLICCELNLPVVLITDYDETLVDFINRINQDIIVFIDEFEKVYDGWNTSLLPLMDGAMSFEHRVLFLLTTNKLNIDDNLMTRPGRVRYIKEFSDLPKEIVLEVVDDLLVYKEMREDVISAISTLPIITIDLIKTIIEECNIHNSRPSEFFDVLNVRAKDHDRFRVTIHFSGQEVVVCNDGTVSCDLEHDSSIVGDSLYVNRMYLGDVSEILPPNAVKVDITDSHSAKTNIEKLLITEDQKKAFKDCREVIVKAERVYTLHRSFFNLF